jgi:hypothetical protein
VVRRVLPRPGHDGQGGAFMSRFTMAAMALAMGAFDTPMPDDGEDPLVRHNDPILQQRCEPATAADVKEFARLARA